ncbi:response regulator [Gemmatimonas sp.]|uniref:response regulator n=1 Tax=Gemmatimonas sp. TaxID=1962908 RepID=UPI003983D42F
MLEVLDGKRGNVDSNTVDKVNILLVDDQPGKLLAYEAMLSELGENLIKASSGREALEHLLKTDITLVLMDVSMPELDGFELAEIIRQHPRYQKTAIIFVSAVHLSDLDRLKGYETGAVDYVSVPVVPELLRAKVAVFAELYRKTREAERLTVELERRVAERTAELEASVARQMELADQLLDADRRKDEFLALLAHELRNPLAPIRNAASIMHMKGLHDPELIWCHEVIERQAKQLTRLVDDLLDVSRITQGKIRLRTEQLDLRHVVQDAVESSRTLIDEMGHELTVEMPDTPLLVRGDPARLTQVVANLLNNAAKYQLENGTIAVQIAHDGTDSVIVVRDRGIGISREAMPRIFDLFAQGERVPDRAAGGLGIGLSLVKQMVELHGGTVRAESSGVGQGSAFVVHIPAPTATTTTTTNGTPDAAHSAEAPRRILVVDDSVDAAESMAMLLRLRGHDVVVAHNGQDALQLAEETPPSVVLLDIGLPGMDGYEVCRRFRASGFDATRIIAMTGYGLEKDRQRATEAGFNVHIVKPVAFADLVKLLAE